MDHQSEESSQLLNGRWFTPKELEDVKETVRLFPKLSRYELALTICEGLSWYAPNGKYKINSCYQLLEKLEAEQKIVLPEKKKNPNAQNALRKQKIVLGSETVPENEIHCPLSQIRPIRLEAVRDKKGIHLWNEYIQRYHTIGYKRPLGAHQRYFIESNSLGGRLGCLLFSAAAWALEARDKWIGWSEADRSQRLHLIVNNTRFLIFPWVQVKNLASHVLSHATRQVPVDFEKRYGYQPVLLETFVDASHDTGTSYRAANWLYLGETQGRGRMDRYYQHLSTPKHIYVYPLVSDFRSYLLGKQQEEGDHR
jgi:hypothetical protein